MTYKPHFNNIISTDNSSTSVINTGNNFTGTWEDVTVYDSVVVAVKTDQNGYFEVQFSPDGVNQDSTLTRYYRTTQIEAPHRFTITRQYFRVVFYNNSGTNQTEFRLQTTLGMKSNLNAPIDSTLSQDFDSIAVRPTDFHTETALNRRQGAETWNKFGYNDDIDTASAEVIAEFGGTFQYLTSGETIDIVSSSANDTNSAGTGARQLIIWGVDENWEYQLEVVNLNGTTTVTTTSQWIGINRVSIFLAGSGAKNDGVITITANTSSYNMASMPAGQGTTQQLIFYVPVSYQFLAEWLYFNAIKTSGGSSPEVTLFGHVYSDVAQAEFEVYRDSLDVADTQHIQLSPPTPFVIGEKSILWFTADTDTNNTAVRGRFSGELIRDADA